MKKIIFWLIALSLLNTNLSTTYANPDYICTKNTTNSCTIAENPPKCQNTSDLGDWKYSDCVTSTRLKSNCKLLDVEKEYLNPYYGSSGFYGQYMTVELWEHSHYCGDYDINNNNWWWSYQNDNKDDNDMDNDMDFYQCKNSNNEWIVTKKDDAFEQYNVSCNTWNQKSVRRMRIGCSNPIIWKIYSFNGINIRYDWGIDSKLWSLDGFLRGSYSRYWRDVDHWLFFEVVEHHYEKITTSLQGQNSWGYTYSNNINDYKFAICWNKAVSIEDATENVPIDKWCCEAWNTDWKQYCHWYRTFSQQYEATRMDCKGWDIKTKYSWVSWDTWYKDYRDNNEFCTITKIDTTPPIWSIN